MLAESRTPIRAASALLAVMVVVVAFLAGRATSAPNSTVVPAAGPVTVIDGINVGFPHSPVGATAAAAHDLLEVERAMDSLNPQRTDRAAAMVATPSEAQAVAAHAVQAIAFEQQHGVPLRRVAVSTNLDAYGQRGAVVTVLEEWIYASPAQDALWAIERVSLVWQAGRWWVSTITGAAPSANESLADLRSELSFPGLGDASVR